MRTARIKTESLARVTAATLVAAVLTAGCEVINPGPVSDEFIALPASQQGLVNGSWERMNAFMGPTGYNTALPTREIFHGGQTGSYGHSQSGQAGSMGGWTEDGSYNNAQQMRWIGEEAVRQFEPRTDVPPFMLARAYLAAGYANRIFGDFYCWTVIDGGALQPGRILWERAEGHFDNAIDAATDSQQRQAAYAGRAQARLALGDYAGAIQDAGQVDDDFEELLEFDATASGLNSQGLRIFWAQNDSPYRSWTTFHTYYHDYYAETGDPRVPWAPFPNPDAAFCLGALSGYGKVECFKQMKYLTHDDDMMIASGAEMRLVEAEAMLNMNPGNWQAAMDIINANRVRYTSESTGEPLEPWVANNLDDAWTFLMRERGIETWLEARRAPDSRRWEPWILEYGTLAADGMTELELEPTTPGVLDFPCFECVMLNPESNIFTDNDRGRPVYDEQSIPRELCYSISNNERNNNDNFDDDGYPIVPVPGYGTAP